MLLKRLAARAAGMIVLALTSATLTQGALAQEALAQSAGGTSDRRPFDLQVEGATAPIGLDALRPRLGWTPPVMGQSAYQVRVGRSEDALARGEIEWDTGRIADRFTVEIPYGGPPLSSRERRVWQVRLWDERGRATDWSAPSSWETGLLAASDWNADWIAGFASAPEGWGDVRIAVDFTLTGRNFELLFRARPIGKTYGEAYVWRIGEQDGQAVLLMQKRQYPGGERSNVRQTVLDTVILPMTPAELRARPRRLVVEAQGTTIRTWLDDMLIAEATDETHQRGTVGFVAPEPLAAVIHALSITSPDGDYQTRFEHGDNPLTGGSVGPDGLILASGVAGKDLVLPPSNPAPLMRRSFRLEGEPVSARLYVAAAGFADLSLNGAAVADSPLAAGWTDYADRVQVQSLDVMDHLVAGENVLAAELGRGLYGVTEPNEWYFHMAPWHGEPVLKLQLEITYADGRRQTVASDATWRAADGPTLHDSLYAGERRDARREPQGWRAAGFDDSGWRSALAVEGPSGVLVHAGAEPIRPVADLRAQALTEVRPGVWLYDFGGIVTGRPVLTANAPSGRTLTLTPSEKTTEDGSALVVSGLIDAQLQTYRYTASGRGLERWAPGFSYAGFRYIQLEGYDGAPDLDTVTAQIVHSDVPVIARFDSGDARVNSINDAARRALMNNTHGLISDTPSLEKNGWTGDAQASSAAAAVNFDMRRVWTKWLADFRDAQADSGELPEIVPSTPYYGFEQSPGWFLVWGPTPPWDAAMFVIPEEMRRHYGDVAILAEMYDGQKRLVDYTLGVMAAPDFRRDRGLGDYAGTGPYGPTDGAASAYLFYMVDTLSQNARRLGRVEDAEHYAVVAGEVRDAYTRKYWNAEAGRYEPPPGADGRPAPYSQTMNVLPVAFGMAPEGEVQRIIDGLAEDLRARDYAPTMGVYSLRHALLLLSDHGHGDVVWGMIQRTEQPGWGYWLENDISSMLEGWGLGSRSWNHHYFALVSDWFVKGLAGLRPIEPGYARIQVRPFLPDGLDHAGVSLRTPRGEAVSRWNREGGQVVLEVVVPGAAEAEVWLPNGGDRLRRAPAGARWLRSEPGHAVYEVGPGRHMFNFTPATH